jgi:beta-glucanase (GH16 family)
MLVWEDDFDGPSLNMETWTEVDRKNNYNNELQYYTPLNSYIRNGRLYLTAKKENRSGKRYTSAMVETKDKYSIKTGRIEVKARMPAGQGLFPAIWLMSYTGNTEIDIMEMIGSEPDMIYAVNHYHTGGKPAKTYDTVKKNSTDGFHVYALEWEEDELRWYVDGKMFHHTKRGVPDEEMYLILTLAVGGNWPGSPKDDSIFPRSMVVDYVKYYRRVPKSTGGDGESAGESGGSLTTRKNTPGI